MDLGRLAELLRQIDPDLSGGGNRWTIRRRQMDVLVLADGPADRLRLLVPVAKIDATNAATLERLLAANFESARDARYAIFDHIVWSAFNHPLSSLQAETITDALDQVITLALTTGTTYSSTGWRDRREAPARILRKRRNLLH